MKTEIYNAKTKFLNPISNRSLAKHNPDFYKSILEAAERGELWGMYSEQDHFTQLEIDFNSSQMVD